MGTGIPPHGRTSSTYRRSIAWLRRDLRLRDNAALHAACNASERVCAVFIVDPALLRTPRIGAPLVTACFDAVAALRADLRERDAELAVLYGDPAAELPALAARIGADAIFYAEDYEPYALERDARAEAACRSGGIAVHAVLDHVYFGATEVERPDGEPYRIFTPYKNRWLARAGAEPRAPLPAPRAAAKLLGARDVGESGPLPEPESFGFARCSLARVSEPAACSALDAFARSGIDGYAERRDVPALDATSHLSVHLRVGTIGIRTCVDLAFHRRAAVWLNELIWRDFYQTILRRFPHVAGGPFLPAGRNVRWRRAPRDFAAWSEGRTGYPLVDAAMRQLNTTGWMHNRLRMIAASFLAKHLLLDWREGELYFEQHLIDADLAQNNGGWQWSASTGTDAAPYFRIFNPVAQSKRYDPRGEFIRAFVPELRGVPDRFVHEPWKAPLAAPGYPPPIVDHAAARARALAAYGAAFSARA